MMPKKIQVAGAALLAVLAPLIAAVFVFYPQARGKDVALDQAKPHLSEVKVIERDVLSVRVGPANIRVGAKDNFEVRLRVTNTSPVPQELRVKACSWYQHWRPSTRRLQLIVWCCGQDAEVTETLRPGQVYEKKLSMWLEGGRPGEEIRFKMGFTPIGGERTFWSNEVILQVKGGDGPRKAPRDCQPGQKAP